MEAIETTEALETMETEFSVSDIEYVDDSVVKVEGEERPLNYLEDTTEYEEWFSDTEEVDAISVEARSVGDAKSSSKVLIGAVALTVLVIAVVIVILRKRK